MKKIALATGLATALLVFGQPAAAQVGSGTSSVAVGTGKQLFDSTGRKVGAIYRVTADGNPQVILNGKLVTIPASTLSNVNGKITTSLSKADLEHS